MTPMTDAPLDAGLRDQLANVHGLLVLSMLLTECSDERDIPELARAWWGRLGGSALCDVYVAPHGWTNASGACDDPAVRDDLEVQFAVLSSAGGPVAVQGKAWSWAFTLRSVNEDFGFLVVSDDVEPASDELFLLRVLAQQMGVALANTRRQESARSMVAELREANHALAATVTALELNTLVHERLDQVAASGGGAVGVARELHRFTGLPVAVEGPHGNLLAWAGPDQPDAYPLDATGERERTLRRALREQRPQRAAGGIVAAAGRDDRLLGALVLIDPGDRAQAEHEVTLAHGARVLTIELDRQWELAETERRFGRDLLDELVSGIDEQLALARAQERGHDLSRPHRVLVVEPLDSQDAHEFFHAVRRAARDTEVGTLLAEREGTVVVLAHTDADRRPNRMWESLHAAIAGAPGGGECRIGVGDVCDTPTEIPRSYDEARSALRVQLVAGGHQHVTDFARLGVFRLFAEATQLAGVERFVRHWLGALLEYDDEHRSTLVATLSSFLENGGNYDATARSLDVHRSTIKYRLRRIREIAGRDLSDPDTHFNLQLATRARLTLVALQAP
jgi:sugar diacid utilization regulator